MTEAPEWLEAHKGPMGGWMFYEPGHPGLVYHKYRRADLAPVVEVKELRTAIIGASNGYWLPSHKDVENILSALNTRTVADVRREAINSTFEQRAKDLCDVEKRARREARVETWRQAREIVGGRIDWHPDTVRDDLLLAIDMEIRALIEREGG